jgi:hypothetical protein
VPSAKMARTILFAFIMSPLFFSECRNSQKRRQAGGLTAWDGVAP